MEKTETELLQAVIDARQKVSKIDTSLSEAKESKRNVETALIEYLDGHDIKSFKSATLGCSCVRKETLYVSMDKEKKEKALKWIEEDCGRPDLLKLMVHSRTLTSFIGERLKEGKEILQGAFKYYFKPELTIIQTKNA